MTNFSKLTIIALTFSLIFISCKDSSITSSQESEIQTSEIGYYHNQALDFVFDNKNVDPSTLDYSELRDIITERLADKYPTKFNHKLFVENKLAINKGLTKSGFLKFENPPKNLKNLNDSNPEFSGDYNSFISYLKENNHISQTLYSRLMKLYNNKKSWLSKGDPVEFAKSEVSVETLPNSDKKFANAFLSTL